MKKFILLLLTMVSFSTLANASLNSTSVIVKTVPGIDSILSAQLNLVKAVESFKAKDNKRYKVLIEQTKSLLEEVEKKIVYKSAFIAFYNGQLVNYFDAIIKDYSDIRYEVMINETCFRGSIKSAKSLLDKMIEMELLNYDEVWYANPEIKDGSLYIDMIDGPNEYSENLKIKICK